MPNSGATVEEILGNIPFQREGRKDYQRIPQLPRDSVRFLWHTDYYDGPICGLALHNNQKYWFEQCDEFTGSLEDNLAWEKLAEACKTDEDYAKLPPAPQELSGWSRRYVLIELTPQQLEEEQRFHRLFQEKVGARCDYDDKGKTLWEGFRSRELHEEFYNTLKNRTPQDFSKNQVLGWFER